MTASAKSMLLVLSLAIVIIASLFFVYDKRTDLLGLIHFYCNIKCPHVYSSQLPLSSRLSSTDVVNLKIGQARMTEMLRVFDEICIKNNIEYFVIGGTLLGAVAYKDWIPWDGDVDVEILRSDWNKLVRELLTGLPENMWLQTEKTDKHYRSWLPNFVMGKIRDLDSCYHNCQDGKRYHNGFMIDLNLYYFNSKDQLVAPDNKKINYMRKEDVYPLRRIEFDSIWVNAPHNAEKYLKRNYNSNYSDVLPQVMRYPHEGVLDPHKSCPHHQLLYPHMYDETGARIKSVKYSS